MAKTNPSNSMRFRVKIVMTAVFLILFSVVGVNFFKISVVNNEKYQDMANDQHFGSITIPAHRGSIYDSKGAAIARSASVYRIFLDPKRFRQDMEDIGDRITKRNADKANGTYAPKYDEDGKETDVLPESVESLRTQITAFLSSKLEITPEKVQSAMEENSQYSVLQDQVEKPVADEVLEYFDDLGFISLRKEEDTKRYYPQNELAASVIGFTSGDGSGAYGIEAYYDDYLAGVDGKTISAKDSAGNELPYRYSKTYEAENGDDVYLTIDMTIQHYLEENLKEMVDKYEIKNRACAILMNAKTGAVLGMATNPSFDLNNPRAISDPKIAAQIEKLTGDEADKKRKEEQEKQWKNKCITETYEPGSVFKVITSASAIEENLIDLLRDSFYCSGSVKLEGARQPINCHNTAGHGAQSFQQALTNSCNPAFMEIGARLGIKRFCYYFDAFGLREKSGIDLPAESTGVGFPPDEMTNVDLAVSAFGQGETITPMEMITSYCAAVN
ncbi:MAG: peptidoglycan glycosyltransferase, partial [Ruminococcus sp.]|nr:peptidoglycan glycosyltransferase [Ruminococcus sp.]